MLLPASLTQTYTTDDNRRITLPVSHYYSDFINAAAALFFKNRLDVCVITAFMDGLDENVRTRTLQAYPRRGEVPTRITRLARRHLREILAHATKAQDDITIASKLVTDVIAGNGPSFTAVPVPNQQVSQTKQVSQPQVQSLV